MLYLFVILLTCFPERVDQMIRSHLEDRRFTAIFRDIDFLSNGSTLYVPAWVHTLYDIIPVPLD